MAKVSIGQAEIGDSVRDPAAVSAEKGWGGVFQRASRSSSREVRTWVPFFL